MHMRGFCLKRMTPVHCQIESLLILYNSDNLLDCSCIRNVSGSILGGKPNFSSEVFLRYPKFFHANTRT
jgi:hypothetical protein